MAGLHMILRNNIIPTCRRRSAVAAVNGGYPCYLSNHFHNSKMIPKITAIHYVNVNQQSLRLFAATVSSSKKKKKKKRYYNGKKRPWQQKLPYESKLEQQKRMKNLHPAAKMKRIISACDYWFSINLQNDSFIKQTLIDYKGYIPLSTISTFPKLQHWGTDLELIYNALTNDVSKKKYSVIFNKELIDIGGRNRIRRMLRRRDLIKYIDLVQKIDRIRKLQREEEGIEGTTADDDALSTPEYMNAKQELEKLELELVEHNTSQFDSYEEDEELPHQIMNDGITENDDLVLFNAYEYALLRPKRIDYTRLDDDEYYIEQINNKPPKQPKKKRIGKSTLPKYTSDRKIHVIRSTKQLNFFCNTLNSSNETVLGFDVEFCTLDEDIRNSLPAMLSIASSDNVGLIWLDKFDNNGKDMLSDPECEPLLSLLANSSIQKVGVAVTADAQHLASWWGVTDTSFTSHYFSNMVDMNHITDNDKLCNKSLQEMVAEVSQLDLPKLKEKDKQMKKEMRKRGKMQAKFKTSHWRSDELTPEMKQYAADDAGSALDVWNAVYNTWCNSSDTVSGRKNISNDEGNKKYSRVKNRVIGINNTPKNLQ